MYRSALPEPTDDLISIFSTRKPDSFYWEIETEKVCPGGKTAPGFFMRTAKWPSSRLRSIPESGPALPVAMSGLRLQIRCCLQA
jgi:hypothetical protein